jgi:hypothetical protein
MRYFASTKSIKVSGKLERRSMYSHNIEAMAEAIAKVCGKKEEVIKVLEAYWADKIAIIWGVEDIIDRAKDLGKKIRKRKACIILNQLHHNHDCSLGITWDVIDTYL